MAEARIDARGMRCPWPVLRAARAMRDGDTVTIRADDPSASEEIAALAAVRGWAFAADGDSFTLNRRER